MIVITKILLDNRGISGKRGLQIRSGCKIKKVSFQDFSKYGTKLKVPSQIRLPLKPTQFYYSQRSLDFIWWYLLTLRIRMPGSLKSLRGA